MSSPDAVQTFTPALGQPTGTDRTFASKGDPQAPGACLWCGDKLQITGPAIRKTNPGLAERHGAYADDAFCGLRCGYSFGLRLAILGSRLRVKP